MGKGWVLRHGRSCLRRNDGKGRGSDGMRAGVVAEGVLMDGLAPCPLATSPLEGGRDELGKRWVLRRAGSCLRRNDGKGRGSDGMRAGVVAEGVLMDELALCPLATSHPPPNLPPGRGEG